MNQSLITSKATDRSRKSNWEVETTTAIERALSSLGYAELKNVQCGIEVGQVVLEGAVSSYHHKQLAQQAALRFVGPAGLQNRVRVKWAI
jgi:osmotically-inducible protein OsmY